MSINKKSYPVILQNLWPKVKENSFLYEAATFTHHVIIKNVYL